MLLPSRRCLINNALSPPLRDRDLFLVARPLTYHGTRSPKIHLRCPYFTAHDRSRICASIKCGTRGPFNDHPGPRLCLFGRAFIVRRRIQNDNYTIKRWVDRGIWRVLKVVKFPQYLLGLTLATYARCEQRCLFGVAWPGTATIIFFFHFTFGP